MVNDNNQEVKLYTTSYKKYKEKSKFKRKRGRKFSFFLVCFFFKQGEEKENFRLLKSPP